ncbi:MAG: 4-aminobutyraldehyde dehydrogenase, partial [uncultured Nocardioides sp.]
DPAPAPQPRRRPEHGRGVRRDLRRHRPQHGRGLRPRPAVGGAGRRPGVRRRRARVRGLGLDHPAGAVAGPAAHRGRARGACGRVRRGRVPRHGQAAAPDRRRGDAADRRPLPVLRGGLPGAGRQVRRGVPRRPHVVHPPGAHRRRRAGDAVELPPADDGVEDRARARGGQHRRAEALGHHPGDLDDARGARPGVPPTGGAQRDLRRPGHRPGPRLPPDPADGGDHRLGPRRDGGGRVRLAGPQAGAPRAGRQGARHRARRRRPRGSGRGDRRRRLLQRRPGLHRGDPGPGGPGGPRRVRRRARRAGAGDADRDARRPRGGVRRPEQRRPARPRRRHGGRDARPRRARHGRRGGGGDGLLLRPDGRRRAPPGRRPRAGRDLRAGDHRPVVHQRGRGAPLRQRVALRPRVERVDQGPRPGDAGVTTARLRRGVDQHPHPVRLGDAARRLQALRLRQGPVDVRPGGLHPGEARDVLHRGL